MRLKALNLHKFLSFYSCVNNTTLVHPGIYTSPSTYRVLTESPIKKIIWSLQCNSDNNTNTNNSSYIAQYPVRWDQLRELCIMINVKKNHIVISPTLHLNFGTDCRSSSKKEAGGWCPERPEDLPLPLFSSSEASN